MFTSLDVDLDSDLIVLVGVNGSGKSTVLEAARIAIAAFFIKLDANSSASIARSQATVIAHDYDGEIVPESVYPVVVTAHGLCGGESIEWTRSLETSKSRTTRAKAETAIGISKEWQAAVQKGDASLHLPIFAYYGTNRLWKSSAVSANGKIEKQGRLAGYDNCLDASVDYELMRTWFQRKTLGDIQRVREGKPQSKSYRAVAKMLAQVFEELSNAHDVHAGYDIEGNDISLSYSDASGVLHYDHVRELSDGYRDIFVLFSDIAFRMTLLNPGLGEDVLEQTPGVVLIDELDLHLHPRWQSQIVPLLRKVFPKVQFIGTTHSPIVLSSIDANHIRIFEDADLYRPNVKTYGSDVESILLSLMGTESRIAAINEMFHDLRILIDDENHGEAEELIGKIEPIVGNADSELEALKTSLMLAKLENDLDID